MSEINNLMYFLNSIKDILPFKNSKDFTKKITESKDFRIKLQKLVFLSKYFGWDNYYHFNFHNHGPFSLTLSRDYNNIKLENKKTKEISKINLHKFKRFIGKSDVDILEAQSTILYYSNILNIKSLNKNDTINILKSLNPHLSEDIVVKSHENIMKFNLFNKNIVNTENNNLKNFEIIVKDKAKGLIDIFEKFDISSNRLFILGSLDYFRIVFKYENIDNDSKLVLLNKFYKYSEKIEKEYFINYSKINNFAYLDLSNLKYEFNLLEDYVSNELKIIPKFDETSDLSMFF